MKVVRLHEEKEFIPIHIGHDKEELTSVFCCDLLSIAMSKAKKGDVWVTVMANMNTIAVASLTEVGAIILAEGMTMEQSIIEKAKEENISIFATSLPVFEAAYKVHGMIYASN